VLLLGLGTELRGNRLLECNHWCRDELPGYFWEVYLGGRGGVGYDRRYWGIRGGVLAVLAPPNARIGEHMVAPDVQIRLGSRDVIWSELGFGAYDAATALRPGLYLGLGVAVMPNLVVSGHYGLHAGLGTFGRTVIQLGDRLDVFGEHAFESGVRLGLGGSHQSARGLFETGIWEGRGQVSVPW
jgi:hypothetical protein